MTKETEAQIESDLKDSQQQTEQQDAIDFGINFGLDFRPQLPQSSTRGPQGEAPWWAVVILIFLIFVTARIATRMSSYLADLVLARFGVGISDESFLIRASKFLFSFVIFLFMIIIVFLLFLGLFDR